MRTLGILYLVSAIGVFLFALSRSGWEATLNTGDMTYVLRLPRSPFWDPPATPTRTDFTNTFPNIRTTSSLAIVHLQLGETFLDASIRLWGVSSVFGLLYLILRRNPPNPLLHTALCLAATFTGAGILYSGIWLIFGGWSGPFPEVFALVAIVMGIRRAIKTYPPKAA